LSQSHYIYVHLCTCKRNSLADSRLREEEEAVLQAPEKIPLQPVVRTMVRQAVPVQPMEDHTGTDIHTKVHGGPHRLFHLIL